MITSTVSKPGCRFPSRTIVYDGKWKMLQASPWRNVRMLLRLDVISLRPRHLENLVHVKHCILSPAPRSDCAYEIAENASSNTCTRYSADNSGLNLLMHGLIPERTPHRGILQHGHRDHVILNCQCARQRTSHFPPASHVCTTYTAIMVRCAFKAWSVYYG